MFNCVAHPRIVWSCYFTELDPIRGFTVVGLPPNDYKRITGFSRRPLDGDVKKCPQTEETLADRAAQVAEGVGVSAATNHPAHTIGYS
jgi:hypothetical protein